MTKHHVPWKLSIMLKFSIIRFQNLLKTELEKNFFRYLKVVCITLINMGVDGFLLKGRGFLINPHYLSDEDYEFLNALAEKYDIITIDPYIGNSRNIPYFIWADDNIKKFEPSSWRRPLILNSAQQLTMMIPMGDRMDLGDKGLWESSYNEFTIMLKEASETKADAMLQLLGYKTYETLDGTGWLHLDDDEWARLSGILQDKRFTLAGKFIRYQIS